MNNFFSRRLLNIVLLVIIKHQFQGRIGSVGVSSGYGSRKKVRIRIPQRCCSRLYCKYNIFWARLLGGVLYVHYRPLLLVSQPVSGPLSFIVHKNRTKNTQDRTKCKQILYVLRGAKCTLCIICTLWHCVRGGGLASSTSNLVFLAARALFMIPGRVKLADPQLSATEYIVKPAVDAKKSFCQYTVHTTCNTQSQSYVCKMYFLEEISRFPGLSFGNKRCKR